MLFFPELRETSYKLENIRNAEPLWRESNWEIYLFLILEELMGQMVEVEIYTLGKQTRKWTVGEIMVPLGARIIRLEWCTMVPGALLVLVILEVSWPSTGKVELFLLLVDICCLWLLGMSNQISESPWAFEPTHNSQLIPIFCVKFLLYYCKTFKLILMKSFLWSLPFWAFVNIRNKIQVLG